MKRTVLCILTAVTFAVPLSAQERGATALGDVIAGLGVSARVLVIAAHPDDEDTRLITWLAKGRHVDVAYLSLTRGDGGQNLIGNELGEALGVIRTEELLAARRIDGAHQYFTRAYDFGFSKSSAEAFQHWPHDSLLADVITVVRAFRPHIIVSVFSGTPRDGHGQHQAAGILAREAYDAAGDSVRFPARRTAGLAPWTPDKFYRTTSYWNGAGATYFYDAGEYSPLLGRSYAEIAAESRSQHKSQGFGALQRKGAVAGSLRREDSRVAAPADASAERSIFDGVDTTWMRLRREVAPAQRATVDTLIATIAGVRGTFDPYDPVKLLPSLGRIAELAGALARTRLSADAAQSIAVLRDETARAQALASGVAVEATVPRDAVALGDSVPVTVTVYNRGVRSLAGVAVALHGDSLAPGGARIDQVRPGPGADAPIARDSALTDTLYVRGRALTGPWWLAQPRRGDMFAPPIDGESADERASDVATATVTVNGFQVRAPIVQRFADPVKGERDLPLEVAPPISVVLDRTVGYAPASATIDRELHVTVRSALTSPRDVTVSLRLPAGLTVDSARRTVRLDSFGASRTLAFRVRGALPAGRHVIAAVAQSGGQTFSTGSVPISYDHIRPQTLHRDATEEIQAVDVKLPPGLNVAYVPGVGDNVAPMLQELGVPVTVVDASKLATTDLAPYTTLVIGTRAYEAQPELARQNPRLFDWVRSGGTMVVQYGQGEMAQPGMMPYAITLSRPAERVTDENSPMRVLRPNDPLLNVPNRITDADWQHWVQDRTLYMPSTFDEHYRSLVSTNDPGEKPNEASILVAPLGRGTYVYTTLAFFRQLPSGIPGAARLFVNLLGARQDEAPHTAP